MASKDILQDRVVDIDIASDSKSDEKHDVNVRLVQDWDKNEETSLVKIDYHIMPMLCVVFAASLLDRNNISSAYISGMSTDLALSVGNRYSVSLLVFFPTYALFELPSNFIIRRVGARNWLSFLVVFWGLMVLCIGLVEHWAPVAVLRALLGAFEAGLFPGAVFLISSWYRTYETASKASLFYMSALIATAFSGILAYGLQLIKVGDGIFRQGWRWIFIIEGMITVLLGFASFLTIGEFPEKAKWLNAREKHIAITRLELDKGESEYIAMSVKDTIKALFDWKLGFYCLQYYVCGTSGYAMSYFLPIILNNGLGFNRTTSLILTGPPYLFTVFCSIALARLSDKYRTRWPFLCGQSLVAVAGLLIILYVKPPGVRYFGTFLAILGSQANVPATLAYGQNQTARQAKRGIVSAAMISIGAAGGVTGSTVFRSQDTPLYLPGMWTTIGLQLFFCVGTFAMSMHLKQQNRLADEGKVKDLEGVKDFRYVP